MVRVQQLCILDWVGHATWKYLDGIVEILWYILKMVVFPLFTFHLRAGFVTAYVKPTVYSFKKYRNSSVNICK